MRPLRICLEDFMNHSLTDIDCSGLSSVLILGRNHKDPLRSMGAGKSTIFKAIRYVLFGETSVKLDKVIRYGCDRCQVTFEFLLDQQIYRVVRSRSRKSSRSDLRLFLKQQDEWRDLSQKTVSETEEELAKIIKITHTAFRTSILFAQADLYGLASVSPKERKLLLKEPLQISIYNQYEKKAKECVTALSRDIDKINFVLERLGSPEIDLDQFSQEQNSLLEEFKGLSTAYQALVEKITTLDSELNQLTSFSNLEDLNKELNQIRQSKNKNNLSIQQTSNSLQEKESLLVKLTQLQNSNTIQLDRINEQFSSIVLDKDFKIKLKSELDRLTSREIDGKSYLGTLEGKKRALKTPIPEGSICDVCYQTITDAHRAACQIDRDKKMQEVLSSIQKGSLLLKKILTDKVELQSKLELQDRCEKLFIDLKHKFSLKEKEVQQTQKEISVLEETINLYQHQLQGFLTTQLSLQEEEQKIVNRLSSETTSSILQKRTLLENSIKDAKLEKAAMEKAMSETSIAIGILKQKIISRVADKEQVITLQQSLVEKKKDLALKIKVQQAFSSSGIPTMIINTVLDDLQLETNKLLSEIFPGIEAIFHIAKTKSDGKEEDTLDISYRYNGAEFQYEEMSGGQQVVIALCLKLALSLIIQRRMKVNINFLMLDEVDSQFDPTTLEAFVKVIKKWQDKFTIFVITHNKYLNEENFTHAILIEGDEVAGSVGTLVTSW